MKLTHTRSLPKQILLLTLSKDVAVRIAVPNIRGESLQKFICVLHL